ncbi:hypothetical protein BBK36DRAFT_1173839 [Trichoderma citrinoviride]|uniref:5'-3' DNA helicase ZGRF1-like N-terminal domain-containing protein n=1 Tax=Trichoderma citrinoviride TaxID=58853 RepID=A0A2T4BLX1_9HYPO|nr:hypothetical protein BBK36DRAFT_1173839 [Trichoderma citrinoviride]PTB70312.1 hypothetical protein BBK36DRAFT_1173839 [Trichoderma citrinoviride]
MAPVIVPLSQHHHHPPESSNDPFHSPGELQMPGKSIFLLLPHLLPESLSSPHSNPREIPAHQDSSLAIAVARHAESRINHRPNNINILCCISTLTSPCKTRWANSYASCINISSTSAVHASADEKCSISSYLHFFGVKDGSTADDTASKDFSINSYPLCLSVSHSSAVYITLRKSHRSAVKHPQFLSICAYSRKKRWQDGKLKFHTFNQKYMVYDDGGGFVGDGHWQGDASEVTEGLEMNLDRGMAIVQVLECTGSKEQDLGEVLGKRVREVEERRASAAAKVSSSTAPAPAPSNPAKRSRVIAVAVEPPRAATLTNMVPLPPRNGGAWSTHAMDLLGMTRPRRE